MWLPKIDEYVVYDKELIFSENRPAIKPRKTIHKRRPVFAISHNNKTLDLIPPKELHKRISLWHPNVRKACVELINNDPEYFNYQLYGISRFQGAQKDRLWRSEFTNSITVGDFLASDELPQAFVHGTDYATGIQILNKGLLPRSESKRKAVYGTHFAASLLDRIYLFANVGSAALAAYQVTTHKKKKTNKAVVLKVEIPDERLLAPDEDAQTASWLESLWTLSSVAYKGVIPPDYIEPLLQLNIRGTHKKLGGKTVSFFKPGKWVPWN